MKWYYIEAGRRVGPLTETEWDEAVRSGKIEPQTLVWHDGMGERWVPFGELPPPEPEEADELTQPVEGEEEEPAFPLEDEAAAEDPLAFARRVREADYAVEIGRCVAGAWACYRAHLWPLAVAAFCTMAITLLGWLLPPLGMVLGGIILGGLYLLYLRLMRGEPAGIANLFEGFKPPLLKPLALQTLVTAVLWMLCLIPAGLAMESMGLTEEKLRTVLMTGSFEGILDPQSAQVLLLVLLAGLLPAVYFSFCWTFSIPLIVDKGLPFWTAMKLSLHKVLQHPWRVGALLLVAGVLGAAGRIFLFLPFLPARLAEALGVIGGFLTMPLYFLVTLRLYEAMFAAPPSEKKEE